MSNQITKEKFEEAFVAFSPQLHSYLLRIAGNAQDAEDIAHDAYLKALKNLDNFLGKSSIKTWIFTIATNLLRDHQRARKRWSASCQENARYDAYAHPSRVDKMKEISVKSAAGAFVLKEHIDFCFTCMAKTLSIEQQIALILKDIYEFTMVEIMEITRLTEGKVKHAIADSRKIMIEIFEDKCTLVSKKGVCFQCSELNSIFNPRQNAQLEIQRLKMKKGSEKKNSKEHLFRLRTDLVKAIDPLNCQGTDLHNYFLELMPQYCDQIVKDD